MRSIQICFRYRSSFTEYIRDFSVTDIHFFLQILWNFRGCAFKV